MKQSINKTTALRSILSGSLRISRPDWNKPIRIRAVIIGFSMLLLCLGAARTGHDRFNVPVVLLVFALDMVGILCIRHTGDLEYGLDLLIFPAVMLLGILIQRSFAGSYYNFSDAFSAFVLMFAMVICLILLTQKGYAHVIWKAINAVTVFSAWCIIATMAGKLVGIRLDKLGTLSNLFFNSWEFSDAYRPCGPFSEPSMYAEFALLSLYYYLFLDRRLLMAGIIGVSLIVSTSALGVVGLALVLVLYLVQLDKLHSISRRLKFTVLIAAAVGIAALIALLTLLDSYALTRTLSGSSLGVRFLRSVDLFGLMTPMEKIFGIGIQNQQNYLNHYNIVLAHDTYETISTNREFASVLGYLPCATGIIGLVAFVIPFLRLFFRGGARTKTIVILFLFVCLFCCIMTHTVFLVHIMAIYAAYDLERRMKEG